MSILVDMRNKTRNVLIEDYGLRISSKEFDAYEEIPQKYSYMNENIIPPLEIENVPGWTQSMILIVEDEDWEFINCICSKIDPTTEFIDEGSLKGHFSYNSIREKNYVGTMPNQEYHMVKFTLICVNSGISLPANIDPREINELLKDYITEKATLIGIVRTKATHWAYD